MFDFSSGSRRDRNTCGLAAAREKTSFANAPGLNPSRTVVSNAGPGRRGFVQEGVGVVSRAGSGLNSRMFSVDHLQVEHW